MMPDLMTFSVLFCAPFCFSVCSAYFDATMQKVFTVCIVYSFCSPDFSFGETMSCDIHRTFEKEHEFKMGTFSFF